SEDLSLNISREMLQQDRQLQRISSNLSRRIKNELQSLQNKDREKYEKFFDAFGRQLKFGVYNNFGANKDDLQDLLLFYSSTEGKLVTLKEYIERMPEEQKYIYYATGESKERIEKLPQTELVADAGYEILYFTEDVDEFAIQMLREYDEKEFKSVSSGDLGIEDQEKDEEAKKETEEHKDLFDFMKGNLAGKVSNVRVSTRLKSHPVCLTADGEISIEMERILQSMPNNEHVQADKVLEVNADHPMFNQLSSSFETDKEQAKILTNILYNQALLIEGLPLEDPVEYANDVWKVLHK